MLRPFMENEPNYFRRLVDPEKLPSAVRSKWTDGALNEGIIAVPKKMLRNLSKLFGGNTGVEQLQVALTLIDQTYLNAPKTRPVDFLAFLAGLTPEQFMLRLRELQAAGYITYENDMGGLSFHVGGLIKAILNETPKADDAPPQIDELAEKAAAEGRHP